MIAIGIGCRKDCPADDIVALVRETVAFLPPSTQPEGLFSIEAKRGEAGLVEAATLLGLPIGYIKREELRTFADGASHTSDRVLALHNVPSVAETAALAGAGEGSVLLIRRRASARATCAIAGPLLKRSAP